MNYFDHEKLDVYQAAIKHVNNSANFNLSIVNVPDCVPVISSPYNDG